MKKSRVIDKASFTDKDPVIDVIRTLVSDMGVTHKSVTEDARIHPQTLANMLYGKTRRPQHRTVTAICNALGVEVRYVYRSTGTSVEVREGIWRQFVKARKARKLRVIKGGKR